MYRVDRKIGEGGFGVVYAEVAMKFMSTRDGSDVAKDEAQTYSDLSGVPGIPRVLWFGELDEYFVIVQEILGPSLADLFSYCGEQFSLKTILFIADQAISRIKNIHDRGYLHRDIKPDNSFMGVGRQGNVLHVIEFGVARKVSDAAKGGDVRGFPFCGTRRFSSINSHTGCQEQSKADDLESLGYVLLYFAMRPLPWQDVKAGTTNKKDEIIKEMKIATGTEDTECLPKEFTTYIHYVRSLKHFEKPNYAYLRRLFRRLPTASGTTTCSTGLPNGTQ